MTTMHFSKFRATSFCLLICTIFWSVTALSDDDAYLQALEAEAEASDETKKTQPQPETSKPTPQASKQSIESGLLTLQHKIEFTTQLSHELPATSRAYYKLNNTQKQNVIDIYFKHDKDMSKATQLLFNLYFKNRLSN